MASTIYDIRLRYIVDSRRAVANLSKMDKAALKSTGTLKRLGNLAKTAALGAAAGGLYFGGRLVKGMFDYNSAMEQAKTTMAGMIALNTGTGFNASWKLSEDLVGKLQKRAEKSVGTTQDMVDMASRITRPITAAGLGMKELEEVTAGSVVAAKAFGIEAGMAALDIEQALGGTLSKRDRFARALLEPMGLDTKKFNAMSAKARAEALKKALTAPEIQAMADRQAKSFAGRFSTFKDKAQIFLGKVGAPLFEAVTKELEKANAWMDKNSDKMKEMAQVWGKKLVDGFYKMKEYAIKGFGMVRDAIKWVVEHKGLLIKLAKLFLAFKIGKGVVGGITDVVVGFNKFSSVMMSATGAMNSFAGALGTSLSRLGLVGAAAGVGYMAGTWLVKNTDIIDRITGTDSRVFTNNSEGRQRGALQMGFQSLQGAGPAGFGRVGTPQAMAEFFMRMRQGMSASVLGEDFNEQRQTELMKRMADSGATTVSAIYELKAQMMADEAEAIYQMRRVADQMAPFAKNVFELAGGAMTGFLKFGGGPSGGKGRGRVKDSNVKVTINKIEVESNDPDRFIFGLAEAASDAIRNPGQASRAAREG